MYLNVKKILLLNDIAPQIPNRIASRLYDEGRIWAGPISIGCSQQACIQLPGGTDANRAAALQITQTATSIHDRHRRSYRCWLVCGFGGSNPASRSGILLAYLAAGLVVILVMRMLGEMAAANPETGSFSTYADKALGRWAGFSIGWLYAWFWIIVLGIEATAGAAIMHRWIPGVDQWLWALALMVLLTLTNLGSVKSYGEFEFWFASIKVAAIVLFLLAGIAAILGLIPGVPAPGLSNLLDQGGFLPNGPGAVLAGILVVVFSFFGAEIATIAAGESANPVDAVKKAVKSTVWRILIFYVGSIAVVVTLLPWNSASVAKSPYVAVIELYGIPGAGTIMDIVVLTSVLSCLNSGLYTASRMLFSLSQRGDAPKSWTRIPSGVSQPPPS